MALNTDAIQRARQVQILGRKIVYYAEIGSTNDIAKQLGDADEPEGVIVLADYQSAGRGRLARSWVAPANSSVLMSLMLRPALQPEQIARVTMAASLGVCAAIEQVTLLKAQVKWPNDILLRGKKCAGILAEASLAENRVEHVVVGIGLNVNFAIAEAPGIPPGATTLSDELGHEISREDLIVALLDQIEQYYNRLCAGDSERLRTEWKSRLSTLGQRVSAREGERLVDGIAQDVDADGALLLRTENGEMDRVVAGDVTLQA